MGGFSQATRRTILDRDGGRCVRCALLGEAMHLHHRKLRSQGGTHTPANGVTLCARCHRWVHANPQRAAGLGLIVKSWQVPEEVEVVTWRGRMLLLDVGTLHSAASHAGAGEDARGRDNSPDPYSNPSWTF